MRDNWDYEQGITVFELDERFSEPFWVFHYQLGSIQKYWLMTQDMVAEKIIADKGFFFGKNDLQEVWALDLDVQNSSSNRLWDAVEHDFDFIPELSRIIILCMILSSVETFLKNLCNDLHDDPDLNDRGSYIQRYTHFIKRHSSIEFSKEHLKCFDAIGHIRNSYLHQLDINSIPADAIEFLDRKTSPFAKLADGVSAVHAKLFFKVINDFAAQTQAAYWNEPK